jgi:hypothetical protein
VMTIRQVSRALATLTLVSAALFAMACSGVATSNQPPSPEIFSLNIGNGHGEACDIYVGDAMVIQIPPRTWGSVPNLPRRHLDLTAVCGQTTVVNQITADSPIFTWKIGSNEGPMGPEPCSLKVSNPTKRDLTLTLDMTPLGQLIAGTERAFPGLAPGLHTLKIMDRGGRGTWLSQIELKSGEATGLALKPETASLRLNNNTDEPISFQIGDNVAVRLSPNEENILDGFSPGDWKITASMIRSKQTVTSVLTLTAGAVEPWSISLERSNVEVINQTAEAMSVTIAGKAAGTVPPGGTKAMENLPAGKTALKAKGQTTGMLLEKQETLVAGAMHRWYLSALSGSVTISNDFSESIELYIDSVPSHILTSGDQINLSMAHGPHKFTWRNPMGKDFQSVTLIVDPNRPQTLNMGPGSARVKLKNLLGKTILVFRDQEFQLTMEPDQEAVICGLMGGKYLFEAVDTVKKQAIVRETVTLAPGEKKSWEIKPRTFSLQLKNETGEHLTSLGILRGLTPGLSDGETLVLSLPEGHLPLDLQGDDTKVTYSKEFYGKHGDSHTWVVPKPEGRIQVINHTLMEIQVFISGTSKATLKPGARTEFTGLRPGTYTLSARGPESSLGNKVLQVTPGGLTHWELTTVSGSLRVVNRTSEELEIMVNNQPSGYLSPGGETTLDRLPLTPVDVIARHPRTGASQGIRITPSVEEPPTWYIDPVTGQLKLVSQNELSGKLHIGDETPIELSSGTKQHFVSLSPGWHTVGIQMKGEKVSTLHRVKIMSAQTTLLNLNSGTFTLAVINGTPDKLILTDNNEPIGEVPGGSRKEFSTLIPGQHTFEAASTGRENRWLLKRLHFRGSKTYSWTVPAEAEGVIP